MNPSASNTNRKPTRRIVNRLLISQLVLAALTACVVGLIAFEVSRQAEDRVIEQLLLHRAGRSDGGGESTVGETSAIIRTYESPEHLPFELPDAASLEPGFHEIDWVTESADELHLLVWIRPADGRRIYLLASMPEAQDEWRTIGVLIGAALLVALAGVLVSSLLTRRALSPLVRLSSLVESGAGVGLPRGFSADFENDEIGILARKLEEYIVQREELVEGERQFLRDASHELRTPLTVLQGAVELMNSSVSREDEIQARRLARVDRSIMRMQHTVECLLWLAREDSQRRTLSRSGFVEELDGLVAEWRAALPPEVELSVSADPDAALDEPVHLWLIVIRNLLENAAHHTETGRIEATLGADRIRVTDTGCGIPEESLLRITEAWVRGPETRGHGLGLSIVHRIANRMGWTLDIRSRVGEGTVVTLERAPVAPSSEGRLRT